MIATRPKSSTRIAFQALAAITSIPLALKLAEIQPALGLIVPAALAVYLAYRTFPLLRSRRGQVSAAVTLVGSLLLMPTPASAAIQFSLLFGLTEQMLQTCIFNQVAGFSVATFLMVAPLRLMFIIPIGMNIAEFNKKRNQHQNASDELMAIAYGIVGILAVGLIEPLCVKACG